MDDKLLEWYCAPHLLAEMQVDLYEEFTYQVQMVGEKLAKWNYICSVLGFIHPFAIRRKPNEYSSPPLLNLAMLQNYLTVAFRTLWRSKGYTAINVLGLSVAFCICMYLFVMAYFELSFDAFQQDKDRIFQAYFFSNNPERTTKSGTMPLPLTPALKSEYPEVEAAARFMSSRKNTLAYKGKYIEKDIYLTDPDFFKLFSFPLVKGSKSGPLDHLSGIVLSESTAKTLFGEEDPIGKQVQVGAEGNEKTYFVTGILADAPQNSSVRYDALIRIENFSNYQTDKDKWDANTHQVFVKLGSQVNPESFENRIKPFVKKYFPDGEASLKRQGAKPDDRGDVFALRLQPLLKLRFDTALSNGPPIGLIFALLGVGGFILLIASFNFINLNIARSFTRAREVGVRKCLGANKGQLLAQIWGEAALLCLLGFIGGLFLTYLLSGKFNAALGTKLDLSYTREPGFIALIGTVFILVTLVAGGYPAWLMSRFNPVVVLKGKVTLKRPGLLRNSLLVTQFAISCLLTFCTVIALQQVDFLREQPLGFQKEQVISIPVGSKANGRQVLQRLRNQLASYPGVVAITGSAVNLGRGKDGTTSRSVLGFVYKGKDVSTDWLLVDYDYLKTLNIKLLEGRDFDRAYPTDSSGKVIITESMAKKLGEANPIGKFLKDDQDTTSNSSQVIGVIPDFTLYALRDEKKPITLRISHNDPIHYIFVRVTPQRPHHSMEKLESLWKEVAPGSAFMGSFLDENIDAWYRGEARLSQMFSLASAIAIILSCVGLFAVALLVMEQRAKEIGIRKVLGASIVSIVFTLSRDFVRLTLIALAIALPLGWFAMQKWLENYPVRTPVSGWILAGVGVSALLVTLLTVSFQSIKTALTNPVKSLRSE